MCLFVFPGTHRRRPPSCTRNSPYCPLGCTRDLPPSTPVCRDLLPTTTQAANDACLAADPDAPYLDQEVVATALFLSTRRSSLEKDHLRTWLPIPIISHGVSLSLIESILSYCRLIPFRLTKSAAIKPFTVWYDLFCNGFFSLDADELKHGT
jgi:hypothetical protein